MDSTSRLVSVLEKNIQPVLYDTKSLSEKCPLHALRPALAILVYSAAAGSIYSQYMYCERGYRGAVQPRTSIF